MIFEGLRGRKCLLVLLIYSGGSIEIRFVNLVYR